MTRGTFKCTAAAAIQASANEIGLPFFSQPRLIRAHAQAVSVSGSSVVKRARKRCMRSRRLAPQFFASMPYSISARVNIHHYRRCGVHQSATGREPSLRSARISATNSSAPSGSYSISVFRSSKVDWRFEDKARRKSHLIRSSFRVAGSLWHLDSSLAHQKPQARECRLLTRRAARVGQVSQLSFVFN